MSLYHDPEPSYQVTEWADPAEEMSTQWGKLCYHNWLKLECERWSGKWRNAWVVEHPGNPELGIKAGSVAMFSYRRYMQVALDMEE